ncbi:armadillo-type protein [Pseudoneurospora amorphoporcata]|uniref:Armadillo-type protein n=1 Tax=Pseudoneurospora amorphoporcata TaxID=241081 RepID=A0AAN6SD95_9PEZI|nr:armadillo-type protein [Pseudoneurospora amorphoporcata]
MSAVAASTGSPNERRASASRSFSQSQDENTKLPDEITSPNLQQDVELSSQKQSISALKTSKLANQHYTKVKMNEAMAAVDAYNMDKLYATISEQQVMQPQQRSVESFKPSDEELRFPRALDHQSSCSSLPITPATDGFPTTASTTRPASATLSDGQPTNDELLRLKQELAQAQTKISRLDQELAHTRYVTQDGVCAMPGLGVDPDFQAASVATVSPSGSRPSMNGAFGHPAKMPFGRDNNWAVHDNARPDTADTLSDLSTADLNRSRAIWNNSKSSYTPTFTPGPIAVVDGPQATPWQNMRGSNQPYEPSYMPSTMETYRPERINNDHDMGRPMGRRGGNRYDNRFGSSSAYGGYNAYNMGPGHYEAPAPATAPAYPGGPPNTMTGAAGMNIYSAYQQPSVVSPLSPHATEFNVAGAPWKTETVTSEGQTYLPATEPLNYRRLLDRNVTCDWKYIVDKIVCNNDQQASIFLQQKLKVGTPEQKYDIVEAIVAQAYPLMVNRFGNFLVQRCFEHGTPEQVIKIAEAIRGNTLNLSMDPFGCHVVQKAFDSVPEDYKAIMVHELLRRIPETVIHRYACHVWQKLFELRWTESPPQIMKYVNDALHGMWHEVALGETGSLVVQNIFENCLEEDKRPCIEEVLANIDIVAHGQFGNWCIQHICEHGAPADRSRAIDHVIRYAAKYSMDQFASKVVEKCLKIGGPEFLGRYLDRVCEGRHDRPRIPLIDIASDQYGNYLIQYILTHANPQHREIVAAHIRKHMVSLRGSKFGSRVGMLCTNHAVVTRPGPGVGPAMGGRIAPGPRFNGTYHR